MVSPSASTLMSEVTGESSGDGQQQQGPRVRTGTCRLVHVDDDFADHVLVRKLLSKLKGQEFEVLFIDRFSEAVECLRDGQFDIALIDYKLHEATGLDLVGKLGGRSSPTPLVILTGRGDHEIDVAATLAGAFDYLDKNELSSVVLERTIRNVRAQFEAERCLRESEERLRRATAEAKAANRAKSEFLARMSHDLRTPLNAILGYSEVMKTEMFGPLGCSRYKSYAGDIHESGQLLLAMVDEVLDLAKVESGTLTLAMAEIAIDELIDSAIKVAQPSAVEAGLSLEAKLEPDLPKLVGDRRLLLRMLINLVSNAVKFTPEGGQIKIWTRSSEDEIEIVVEDNGEGIASKDLDRVIAPFSQSESSDHPYSGVGLGLSIVQSLVATHKGSISIESELGVGTRAILHFPRLASESDQFQSQAC